MSTLWTKVVTGCYLFTVFILTVCARIVTEKDSVVIPLMNKIITFVSSFSKISPCTRSVFKSNSPVHTHPMFGKRLDTILLRHRIRKYPDSPFTRYRIRCGFFFFSFFFFFTLEGKFYNIQIHCRIRRMCVDGSRIRKEKVADSKISGYVWTRGA